MKSVESRNQELLEAFKKNDPRKQGDLIINYVNKPGGLDFGTADFQGNTCLHWAVYNKNLDSVTQVFRTPKAASPNVYNRQGYTPLHWAIILDCSPDIIKILLGSGADPNLTCKKSGFGENALHLATRKGYKQIYKSLLDHNAHADKLAYSLAEESKTSFALLIASAKSNYTTIKLTRKRKKMEQENQKQNATKNKFGNHPEEQNEKVFNDIVNDISRYTLNENEAYEVLTDEEIEIEETEEAEAEAVEFLESEEELPILTPLPPLPQKRSLKPKKEKEFSGTFPLGRGGDGIALPPPPKSVQEEENKQRNRSAPQQHKEKPKSKRKGLPFNLSRRITGETKTREIIVLPKSSPHSSFEKTKKSSVVVLTPSVQDLKNAKSSLRRLSNSKRAKLPQEFRDPGYLRTFSSGFETESFLKDSESKKQKKTPIPLPPPPPPPPSVLILSSFSNTSNKAGINSSGISGSSYRTDTSTVKQRIKNFEPQRLPPYKAGVPIKRTEITI